MEANQVKNLISNYNFEGKGRFLKNCLIDLNTWTEYDLKDLYNKLIKNKFTNIEELINTFEDKVKVARAIHFGKIKKWNDDFFYINDCGYIVSESYDEYLKDFEYYGYDILMGIMEYYLSSDDIKYIENIDELIEHIKNNVL